MPLNRQRNLAELNGKTVTFFFFWSLTNVRVHVLIGSMLVVASLGAKAGEPIVVLEYRPAWGSMNMPTTPAIIRFGWIRIIKSHTK